MERATFDLQENSCSLLLLTFWKSMQRSESLQNSKTTPRKYLANKTRKTSCAKIHPRVKYNLEVTEVIFDLSK
jgi:hypothetical protein